MEKKAPKVDIFYTIHEIVPQPFNKEEWWWPQIHPQTMKIMTYEEDVHMCKTDLWKINYN